MNTQLHQNKFDRDGCKDMADTLDKLLKALNSKCLTLHNFVPVLAKHY